MLRLHDPGIDRPTEEDLDRYQSRINAAGDYASQVQVAPREFKRWNRASNPTFRAVRARLEQMSASPGRCGWCEDSEAGEIDHIRPKALFPDQTFAWRNFLRVCTPCNRSKGDRFSIAIDGNTLDITRRAGDPVTPPPAGEQVLINPRVEDPMEFLELDIFGGTFRLQPAYGLSVKDRQRATYTIGLLKLNRDILTTARSTVCHDLGLRLEAYRRQRDNGATQLELAPYIGSFIRHPHPTVWREMQRQHAWIDELTALFRDVPEALEW